MSRFKLTSLFFIFSILLGATSLVKNKTRILEKKIYKVDRRISTIEKDLHETELDYFYLSSPKNLSAKINDFSSIEYIPMDFSRIHLNYINFAYPQKKISTLKTQNEKKIQKK
tara:strand:- start:55 stop:393 length:339 start_codon:yes stop_codon:yes gene_type:complete